MTTWDVVRRVAMALPEVTEETSHGYHARKVRGSLFAWARDLRKKERSEHPDVPPGPFLAMRVADQETKAELLADDSLPTFTIDHFDGYDGLLVRIEEATDDDVGELLTEAWLCRAPTRLARQWQERLTGEGS